MKSVINVGTFFVTRTQLLCELKQIKLESFEKRDKPLMLLDFQISNCSILVQSGRNVNHDKMMRRSSDIVEYHGGGDANQRNEYHLWGVRNRLCFYERTMPKYY